MPADVIILFSTVLSSLVTSILVCYSGSRCPVLPSFSLSFGLRRLYFVLGLESSSWSCTMVLTPHRQRQKKKSVLKDILCENETAITKLKGFLWHKRRKEVCGEQYIFLFTFFQIKLGNRQCETLLHDIEIASSLAMCQDKTFQYPVEKLQKLWRCRRTVKPEIIHNPGKF